MDIDRRAFLAFTGASLTALAAAPAGAQPRPATRSTPAPSEVDALFDRSVVIDSLSADEKWDAPEPIFEAYRRSRLTAIQTNSSTKVT